MQESKRLAAIVGEDLLDGEGGGDLVAFVHIIICHKDKKIFPILKELERIGKKKPLI
jgi:hypothetical protein